MFDDTPQGQAIAMAYADFMQMRTEGRPDIEAFVLVARALVTLGELADLSDAPAHGVADHGDARACRATLVPCDCGCGRSCCASCGTDLGFITKAPRP